MMNRILLTLALMAALISPEAHAANKAEIMLMPTRIVMASDDKSATVQLKNTGNATGQFSVSLIDMKMNEDGSVVPLEDGTTDPHSAIPYLNISPKSITIRPGESQMVRLLRKKISDLEPGEYRSHLRVKMENDNVEGSEASADQSSTEAVIAVKANLVLIIPVIFRVGETDYTVTLEEPRLNRGTNEQVSVDMYVALKGNRSAMGDFSISYLPPEGEKKLLTFFPGVPVYRSTARRFISVPIDLPEGVSLDKGSLEIIYAAQETEGGQELARQSLTLP